MNGKISKQESTNDLSRKEIQEGRIFPLAPAEEYNYRCCRCGCEVWVNEAIIDFELGFAEFEGREVVMPVLRCPGCNLETLEYTGIKARPKGANSTPPAGRTQGGGTLRREARREVHRRRWMLETRHTCTRQDNNHRRRTGD